MHWLLLIFMYNGSIAMERFETEDLCRSAAHVIVERIDVHTSRHADPPWECIDLRLNTSSTN